MTTTGTTPSGTTMGSGTHDAGTRFFPPAGGIVGLNYYDGRFLRAEDLNLDRQAQRTYVDLVARGGGPGVVAGLQLSGLGTGRLRLQAGSAVAPSGGLLYLPGAVTADVAAILAGDAVSPPGQATSSTGPAASKTHVATPKEHDPGVTSTSGAAMAFTSCAHEEDTPANDPAAAATDGLALFLVRVGPARRLCGDAEVFGRVCGAGCSCATDHPYVVDGVALTFHRITPNLEPFTLFGVTRPELHLRSLVASALFEEERTSVSSLLDVPGLGGDWLAGGTLAAGDDVVSLAVIGWDGSAVRLLDTWPARRERMEAAPRTAWGTRVEQRPWSTFLAQVLQFQDQLSTAPVGVLTGPARILVERGFVELPPAGYLPVQPERGDLHGQLQDLMGPGVAVRLCAVGRDQIPRELERAQHLRRISLLRGLQDAQALEPVDVLVPDGIVRTGPGPVGMGFAVELAVGGTPPVVIPAVKAAVPDSVPFTGAARVDLAQGWHVRAAVVTATEQNVKALADVVRLALDQSHTLSDAVDRLLHASFGSVAVPAARTRAAAEAVREALPRRSARARTAALAVRGPSLQVLAAVTDLSTVVDPFDLTGTNSTDFDAGLTVYVPASTPVVVTVHLRGWLQRVTSDANSVTVRLTAIAEVEEHGLPPLDLPTVSTTVVLARSSDSAGTTLTVTFPGSGVQAVLRWHGSPVEADGTLSQPGEAAEAGEGAEGEDEGMTLATLHALQDPTINRPGNRHHEAAVDAIGVVSGAFSEDKEFAEREYRLLFPEEVVVTQEVVATEDWVLFRRRPWTGCEATDARPVVSVGVTVQVLRAASPDEAEQAVADILAVPPKWPGAEKWTAVAVDFGEASARLLTPAQTWRTAYSTAGGRSLVRFAGYAGRQGVQAATVGLGRTSALVEALNPAADPAPDFQRAFVQQPPPELGPSTTAEGVVFLVTHDPQEEPLPSLAVLGLVSEGPPDQRPAKVRAGDPTVLESSLSALGEGTAEAIETGYIAQQARTMLVNEKVGPDRALEAVLWVHSAESEAVREPMKELAATVVTALAAQVELAGVALDPDATRLVTYPPRAGQPAAMLFLLVSPREEG